MKRQLQPQDYTLRRVLLKEQRYCAWVQMLSMTLDYTTRGRIYYGCQSNGYCQFKTGILIKCMNAPSPSCFPVPKPIVLEAEREALGTAYGQVLRCQSKFGCKSPVGSNGFG